MACRLENPRKSCLSTGGLQTVENERKTVYFVKLRQLMLIIGSVIAQKTESKRTLNRFYDPCSRLLTGGAYVLRLIRSVPNRGSNLWTITE